KQSRKCSAASPPMTLFSDRELHSGALWPTALPGCYQEPARSPAPDSALKPRPQSVPLPEPVAHHSAVSQADEASNAGPSTGRSFPGSTRWVTGKIGRELLKQSTPRLQQLRLVLIGAFDK